jgi:trigger factor
VQISIETMTGLERRMTISVPSQAFEGQVTDRLGKAADQVKLPGFRPGKVPMKEVRRRYGPSVRAEVAGELMQSTFFAAIREEDLVPAGSPSLEVVKMDPGIDFEFTATFEVFPLVELADLSGLNIQNPAAQIGDGDIDAMVERLREQRQTWEPADGPCADGHQVTVDFTGSIDGEPFDGGQGEGVTFVVGGGQMIEDFDRGVLGLSAGAEGDFDAVFPDDYSSEELQGKTAKFHVKVTEVSVSQQPELDDEFFRGFGVEEGGLSAFRDDVRGNMQREMDAAILNQVKTQVMDQLHALHTIQQPQAMIKSEIDALKQQMLQQFQMYGANQAQPELPDELFTEQAERRVSVGLIVKEIVGRAELEADTERVKARIDTLAEQYDDPQQVVNWYYSNQEQLQQIEMAVLEEQVVEHVLDAATVVEVASNYEEIIAGNAVKTAETEEVEDAETAES